MTHYRRLKWPAVWVAVAALLLSFQIAYGATFVVDASLDSHDVDPGDGIAADHANPDSASVSLRAAIEEASALAGPDTVVVPMAVSPIQLTLGSLNVAGDSTVIVGQSSLPTIDGLHNPAHEATLTIVGNGCVVSGLTFVRSRGSAVLVTGTDNLIGGTTEAGRVVLVGNNLDGDSYAAVEIRGHDASRNVVEGCWIGVHVDGSVALGNRIGVHLTQGASGNVIGGPDSARRNLISGNLGWGVVIDGDADSNAVTGNYIGPDFTGDRGPGNASGGVLVSGTAEGNVVGGIDFAGGNLVSANHGDGVRLQGADVVGNFVTGNFIGTEVTARLELSNDGNGVAIVGGAHDNTIGDDGDEDGNVISGNRLSGVLLSGTGTDGNDLIGNFIGIEIVGYAGIGNALDSGAGVMIRNGARNNRVGIGTTAGRNVISGNGGFGVHITGSGTAFNSVTGCFVGVNGYGLSSVFNTVGVVIDSGAQHNTIGGTHSGDGNLISGNRAQLFPYGAGVLIRGTGTDYNDILGNAIGVDINGARALRNGSAGVIIAEGAQHNVIGGPSVAAANVISGNGSGDLSLGVAAGVHIYGLGTRFNEVIGNWIGLSTSGLAVVPNTGHGIGIFAGASDNVIGGDAIEDGNIITGSDYDGILVDGSASSRNLVRYNEMYGNDSLGMAVTNHAQGGIAPPELVEVRQGMAIGTNAPPGARVDIYLADPDSYGRGEGKELVGSGFADAAGGFYVPVSGVTTNDTVTAVAIDSSNNTSEFAVNIQAAPIVAVNDDEPLVPFAYALHQNYPNPFNPTTRIAFSLANRGRVRLDIFNIVGQRVTTLIDREEAAGNYDIEWDGTDQSGRKVASGVYLYRIQSGEFTAGKKMLLLK